MSEKQLKKVSEETMRFMRGRYALDEVGNGKDALTFIDGEKTVLTIYIYDGYYDFAVGQEVIQVTNLNELEKVKEIIIAAKKPNRKPLPKTHIKIGKCGHRCDLCVHYKGKTSISVEEMEYARVCCSAVYGAGNWEMNCDGCHWHNCVENSTYCRQEKGFDECSECGNYNSCTKSAGWPPKIHTQTITTDEVTWAILPYVKGQYGN